jgi:hypothetical protein
MIFSFFLGYSYYSVRKGKWEESASMTSPDSPLPSTVGVPGRGVCSDIFYHQDHGHVLSRMTRKGY